MGFITDIAINAVCHALADDATQQKNNQRCQDIIQYANEGKLTDSLVIDATYTALMIAAVPIIIFMGGMMVGFYLAREYLLARRVRKK